MGRTRIGVVVAAVALALPPAAAAQDPRPEERGAQRVRSWEMIALPVLNFNSDEGVGYGALLEAYRHGAGARPYRYTLQPTLLLTTRGRRDLTIFFDAPALLPGGWRADAFVGREQELAAPYYGRGNDAPYDEARSLEPNPYFYRYGRTRVRVLGNVQRRIGATRGRWLAGAGYAQVVTDATPFDSGTTLLEQELSGAAAPRGTLVHLRAGVVWDSRDREIGPRSGWWNELLLQRVDEAIGSSHSYTRVTATTRRYTPLTDRITAANRVILQQSSGDVPVYDLATVQTSYKQEEGLGGNKMLRGIPKNRVMGKGLVVSNNELRWRATDFSVAGRQAFLLFSGFVDAGRIWEESIQLDEIGSDLWLGYGGGARLGLGSSSVIAVDVGRSSSATQLYIGLGYAF